MTQRQFTAAIAAAAVFATSAVVAGIGQAHVGVVAHAAATQAPPATCVVHSLPAFVAQGEFATTGTVADIVEVECNPEIYGTKARMRITADQLFARCEKGLTWYVPNSPSQGFREEAGRGVTVELDPDGNATVALRAGPNCTVGESLVTAHMEQQPFESFTTSFSVLAPQSTRLGVVAMPGSQVVDAYSSAFAAIIQTEFPGISEQKVRIASEELYHRCRAAPHLRWIGIDGREVTGVSEVTGVPLDNAGNGFLIVIGDASCAAGRSLIEADLEESPFTTLTTSFSNLPPQPTAEPALTIEKRQEIRGSGGGLTMTPLKGTLGQTVDYEIDVKNSARVAETLSALSDPHCDPGTIVGGPGSGSLAPGETTTYTCDHVLTAVGPYVNEATITATTVGGVPLTRTSNQVLVEVPPAPSFALEKSQRLAGSGGSFITSPVTAASGQTVEYRIVVSNTGNVPLKLSGFSDEHCDPGTLLGGPGEALLLPGASTTYTCSRALAGAGTYLNQATVTGTPPGETPITHNSNQVVVEVPAKAVAPSVSRPSNSVAAESKVLPCKTRLSMSGASGPKRGPFKIRVSFDGIKQVRLFLDGRKLKVLKPSQEKGKAAVRIDPTGLAYGGHRLTVTGKAGNSACGAAPRSNVFVYEHVKRFEPTG